MLNRHALVLFFGLAALVLLRSVPPEGFGPLGAAFVALAVGLLVDAGAPGAMRTHAAHALQATGAVLLLVSAARLLWAGAAGFHLALAELGIGLASLGVLAEMRLPLGALRKAVAVQLAGDLLFLASLGLGLAWRTEIPSAVGWVFIALAGLLSLYAAVANAALQVARLKDPQAGWRYRVVGEGAAGLELRLPKAEARIDWRHVEAVRPLDTRHLLLVLPSPIPPGLEGLPVEELRESPEALVPELAPPPEKYAFVLHEQELGRPVDEAAQRVRRHLAQHLALG